MVQNVQSHESASLKKQKKTYTCMYVWDDVWILWLIENDEINTV